MAKFCIHCGRKLKEGEVCDCQVKKNLESDNLGASLLEVIKGIFIKPVDTIKKFTNDKHFTLALILLGIFSVAISLFVISFVKNLSDVATSAMGGISLYAIGMRTLSIPYLKIFFISLIIAILFIFIYTGILYLVNSVMFKGDKDFKKIFSMYGVCSVVVTLSLLVGAIFAFINVVLGVAIFLIGSILNTVYVFKGIQFLGVKDENKHGYIYLITTIFYGIFMFIVSLLFS